MEILVNNNTVSTYKEAFHQIKRIQETTDSVVPDVNEDIGRIATIEHCIMLKSKDITSSGVLISGEADISVLYITENEDSVSNIRISKQFNIEYDIPDVDPKAIAQVSLQLTNIESRIINPRKLSVTFEICSNLSVYVSEAIDQVCQIPAECSTLLKAKTDVLEMLVPNAVCEKTFALNEQYSFPSTKAIPSKIVYSKARINITDMQHVGSKVIVKGIVSVSVCYLADELIYPVNTEFSSSFSQIIDTGADSTDNCSALAEITSCYFDLIETINGEKALDVELHAVIQIVSRKKHCISYVSDTYSNLMPCKNNTLKTSLINMSEIYHDKINVDEKLSVADECKDILCVFPSISHCTISQNKLTAALHFDIIYKNRNGCICSVRRSCALESDELGKGPRLLNYRLSNIYIRSDETIVDAKLSFEFSFQCCNSIEYCKVFSVELDEENKYDISEFPSICMVKREYESLWELAKKYHSSVEKIAACNELAESNIGFIMIPKEC